MPYGSKLHIQPTTLELLSPSCSTRAVQKSLFLNNNKKKNGEHSGEEKKKAGEWNISRKITRQKDDDDDDNCFYIALFSALEQTHCARM